ncbi:uncharacterized protein LOC111703651 [Eurytemora carolleeae]|uniref:uncharacterized protein LOC111703651 n=1 Tax=Eurytemora carolleeae TaxID=1294199 RepID=UPI000C77C464|nr:uncharacterized protein LOC111703651 [Eurytemora carolleeae]|eukprot:XP_023331438.1 uncharacterized protein LOC111703651 [Eurytemora affinis]
MNFSETSRIFSIKDPVDRGLMDEVLFTPLNNAMASFKEMMWEFISPLIIYIQIAGLTLASLIFTAIMIKIWPCIKRCYRITGRCCSCCYANCKKCGNCCWAEAEEVGGCCWMGSAKCFYCSKHCCRFICCEGDEDEYIPPQPEHHYSQDHSQHRQHYQKQEAEHYPQHHRHN